MVVIATTLLNFSFRGLNTYCKRDLGVVKVGRYICPSCGESYEEERSFWEKLEIEFLDVLNAI